MTTDHSIQKRVDGEINRIAVSAGDSDGDSEADSSSINCTASQGAGVSVAA
jgi:hypothetical protein